MILNDFLTQNCLNELILEAIKLEKHAFYCSQKHTILLEKHNSSNGAKFTRGRKWRIIYSKKYYSKSIALKEEYKLKKDYKKRKKIKNNYFLKDEKAT